MLDEEIAYNNTVYYKEVLVHQEVDNISSFNINIYDDLVESRNTILDAEHVPNFDYHLFFKTNNYQNRVYAEDIGDTIDTIQQYESEKSIYKDGQLLRN